VIPAVALLAVVGAGNNARAINVSPASWFIDITNMVVEGGYAMLLATCWPIRLMIRLDPGDAADRGGVRSPAARWLGRLWAGRHCHRLLLAGIDQARFFPVLASAVACGLAVGARAFASEFHKWNRAAANLAEKIRVTALVTLVTAAAGLLTVGALMLAVHHNLLPRTELLPGTADLMHPPTIVLAILVGGALFTAMTFLSFSSVLKIGSENFIATSAFMPLAALVVQGPAAAVGLITLPPFDWRLLPAIVAVILGVMMMIWGNRRAG
jgi:hypothetical protein